MVETRASKRRVREITTQDSTPVIPCLPQEITVPILSKLPVKSLVQFRSFSKPCLALISSPQFLKLHLNSSANDNEFNHHKVILWRRYNLRDCSLRSLLYGPNSETSEMDHPMKKFDITRCLSVNGLICLAGTKKIDKPISMAKEGVSLCIWNPSIRKCKMLPEVTICYTTFRYGFGYDELHDEYKIVVIFNVFGDTKVEIYSMKTDYSWRTVLGFQECSLIDSSAKFVKGKLYWTYLSVHENNDYVFRDVVSFDLANETWDKVEKPHYGEGKFNLLLRIFGGDLVLLYNYERNYSDVWVMNNYGVETSWKKMCTVSCIYDPRNYNLPTHSSLAFSPLFLPIIQG